MPAARSTVAEETHRRLNELMSQGMKLADAARELAEKTGKSENAIKQNYYNYERKLKGSASTGRRRTPRAKPASVDGAVAEAIRILEQARDAMDQEVEQAKAEFETAKARYDELVASVGERKADLQRKIEALS